MTGSCVDFFRFSLHSKNDDSQFRFFCEIVKFSGIDWKHSNLKKINSVEQDRERERIILLEWFIKNMGGGNKANAHTNTLIYTQRWRERERKT